MIDRRRPGRLDRGRGEAPIPTVPFVLALALLTALGGADARTPAGADVESPHSLTTADFASPDEQLSALLARALDENPGVRSAWSRSSASFERVAQEGSLPDPQLTYRYFVKPPETRVGPQEHALELSQGLPWTGKLDLQARRAESMAQGTTWEAEDLERRLAASVKRAYFEAAYLQEALRVNGEEGELLQRFESISLKRYSTGEGIQQNVIKVQTEISRLDEQNDALRERLDVVERTIAELIGAPGDRSELEEIALPLPEPDVDRSALEEAAVTAHPRVRALERRVEADRLWASRRKLDGRPDFRVGVGYTLVGDREDAAGIAAPPEGNGSDVLALSAGVTIPVFRKRIRAGIAEAQDSARAREESLEAARNRLRRDVQDAWLRVDSLGERGRLYRDVIIPQAEESLASAEASYTTNRLGFLDLLDAERILFQSRLAFHRLVSDLWIALTDLELAAATPVPAGESAPSAVATPGMGRTS